VATRPPLCHSANPEAWCKSSLDRVTLRGQESAHGIKLLAEGFDTVQPRERVRARVELVEYSRA
jgi:hypothetical protein